MLRVLESQAPAKQNVTDTINTLCGRLSNASLLEDRRAAIMGLRSFAKEYPASVASGALRGLIGSLMKDLDDVDTSKVILETILMLFSPNETSPEASEEISLWLADEFTQRQDNITVLLDLLEVPDFYSRLYALQIISAIAALRIDRLQECVLAAPLGTSRLVAVLDDPREAIRSAAVLLLIDLTQASFDLQKLVAFENAFERVFSIITSEGSLLGGGVIVQDCLSLLANLLHSNGSNQSLFRETGCVKNLVLLFTKDSQDREAPEEHGEVDPVHEKNLWGLIAIVRMFLVEGSVGEQANQLSFEKRGLLQILLDLSFNDLNQIQNRAEALRAGADIIRGNAQLQERFWQFQVPDITQGKSNEGNAHANGDANGDTKVYIIDALLEVSLTASLSALTDLRSAACECMQAYFFNHTQLRLNFLRRTIDIRASVEDESCNIINILMDGPQTAGSEDPYRIWFAAILTFHLLYGDGEAKNVLMAVSEGDAAKGEEVVTCIQKFTGNLLTAIQNGADVRICVGYLMLLCEWLFENAVAVDDFLGEGSIIQSLTTTISTRKSASDGITEGLAAFLLGTIYEFSTKDSPIPRRKLQSLLLSCRESYTRCLEDLRRHPQLRDFEVSGANSSTSNFDETFVNFFKDNFSRIKRAVDRDPGLEVAHIVEGVDRELVDSLRAQIADKDRAYGRERSDLQGRLSSATAELERIKYINASLQNQMSELEKVVETSKAKVDSLQQTVNSLKGEKGALEENIEVNIVQIRDLEEQARDHGEHRRRAEAAEKELKNIFAEKDKALKEVQSKLQGTEEDFKRSLAANDVQKEELQKAQRESQAKGKALNELELERKTVQAEADTQKRELETALTEAEAKEKERSATQSELDELLVVLEDLEEKRKSEKKALKALGADVSDEEDANEETDDQDELESDESIVT